MKNAEENLAHLTLKSLCGINIKYNQIKIFELVYARNNALMQTYTQNMQSKFILIQAMSLIYLAET